MPAGTWRSHAPSHRRYKYRPSKKLIREVRKLKSLVTSDPKAITVNLETAVSVVTAAGGLHLTPVVEGSDADDRDGRVIHLTNLHISGQLTGAGANTTVVRMLVIKDTQNSGTAPPITDMFVSSTAFAQGDNKFYDPESLTRYKVLVDRNIIVGGATGNDNFRVPFRFDLKLDHRCYYPAATSTPGKGSLWWYNATDLTSSPPTMTGNAAIQYLDI